MKIIKTQYFTYKFLSKFMNLLTCRVLFLSQTWKSKVQPKTLNYPNTWEILPLSHSQVRSCARLWSSHHLACPCVSASRKRREVRLTYQRAHTPHTPPGPVVRSSAGGRAAPPRHTRRPTETGGWVLHRRCTSVHLLKGIKVSSHNIFMHL